ncbi:hypothetical protein [Latilactobacillus sakei]|uniref:hypothetical protein n=1 Tax=Latilactobacillus sakei TaxID=1599 RepID=UPI003F52DDE7
MVSDIDEVKELINWVHANKLKISETKIKPAYHAIEVHTVTGNHTVGRVRLDNAKMTFFEYGFNALAAKQQNILIDLFRGIMLYVHDQEAENGNKQFDLFRNRWSNTI